MDQMDSLREQLKHILDWEEAHVSFETAVHDVSPWFRGAVPHGQPHTLWQLLEHIRRTQWDILDFCRNPAYVGLSAEEHWPPSAIPPSGSAWEESLASCRRDRDALKQLAADVDLFAQIPHGTGQTYLRELLLVADHTAYHVGQLVLARRALDIWPPQ